MSDYTSAQEYEWAARLKLEQGDFHAAKRLLECGFAVAGDGPQRRILQLQILSLEAQSTGRLEQALEQARNVIDSDTSQDVILRVFFLRLELLAGVVRLTSPDVARARIEAILPELAETSPFQAAIAERWLAAASTSTADALACAERSERHAVAAGFPHLGADAWLVAAKKARSAFKPTETVLEAIEHAHEGFEASGHAPGRLAVEHERCMVRWMTADADPQELESLCARANALGATTLGFSMRNDLATLLRERGRSAEAHSHAAKATEIAAKAGMGNLFRVDSLERIEALRGAGKPVAAIRQCDQALSEEIPEIVRALILQAKARCLWHANAPQRAAGTADEAAAVFKALGAEDLLSILVSEQALHMSQNVESRDMVERVDQLLADTMACDLAAERVLRALEKAIHRCELGIHAFNALKAPSLLDDAEVRIAEAKDMSAGLPQNVRDSHLAACLQVEAQVLAARAQWAASKGNLEEVGRSLAGFRAANREAMALALACERLPAAAGCAMMAGIVDLNAALDAWRAQQAVPKPVPTQTRSLQETRAEASRSGYEALAQAASLYEVCGEQTMAARARAYQAEISANAAIAPALWSEEGLTEIALRHLQEADDLYEIRRGEMELATPNETLAARQALSKDTERIVDLALRILVLQAPDTVRFWEWLQKAKSRSLTDALAKGRGQRVPITFAEAQEVLGRLDTPAALVDWCVTAGEVYLVIATKEGPPCIERLALSEEELNDRIAAVAGRSVRATLASTPEMLGLLEILIAPLAWMTRPETLLVLCPMGGIGALPLHAIRIEGVPLIQRNPVIMVPNHAVGLKEWRAPPATTEAALFSDPTSDLRDGSNVRDTLTRHFGQAPITGADVTARSVQEAIERARVIHYHGHAWHDQVDPLVSALDLATGPMTAAEIISGPRTPAELVVLGACQSGVAQIARGNEANGLTQAFLLRGAARVVSTLWNIPESAANAYAGAFYDGLDRSNVIAAHRAAIRGMIEAFGEDRPDLWAPLILSGRLVLNKEHS